MFSVTDGRTAGVAIAGTDTAARSSAAGAAADVAAPEAGKPTKAGASACITPKGSRPGKGKAGCPAVMQGPAVPFSR